MTAKEAKNVTNRSIQEKKTKEQREEAEKEKRRKQYLNWLKDVFSKEQLVKIDKLVTKEASEGKHNLIFTVGQNEHGKFLADILVPELIDRGFIVEYGNNYIPEYGGSGDDGYAYAHDSYVEHTLIIKW